MPTELLEHIGQSATTQTLVSLCLVNRRVQGVMTYALYRKAAILSNTETNLRKSPLSWIIRQRNTNALSKLFELGFGNTDIILTGQCGGRYSLIECAMITENLRTLELILKNHVNLAVPRQRLTTGDGMPVLMLPMSLFISTCIGDQDLDCLQSRYQRGGLQGIQWRWYNSWDKEGYPYKVYLHATYTS